MNGLLEKTIQEDGAHPSFGVAVWVPQTGMAQTTEMPSLSFLGWSPRLRCQQWWVPFGPPLRENGPRPLPQLLVALRHSLTCGWISSSPCFCTRVHPHFPLSGCQSCWIRTHPHDLSHLNLTHHKDYFPSKVTSIGTGNFNIVCGGWQGRDRSRNP